MILFFFISFMSWYQQLLHVLWVNNSVPILTLITTGLLETLAQELLHKFAGDYNTLPNFTHWLAMAKIAVDYEINTISANLTNEKKSSQMKSLVFLLNPPLYIYQCNAFVFFGQTINKPHLSIYHAKFSKYVTFY